MNGLKFIAEVDWSKIIEKNKKLQADLDADVWEEYQVIDPDNVEPPEKGGAYDT